MYLLYRYRHTGVNQKGLRSARKELGQDLSYNCYARAAMAMSEQSSAPASTGNAPGGWLNRTVLGTGLTSLASDWSHEMATTVLPGLLVMLGAGPGWLGAIEGAADGLSSFTKLAAGHWTDRLHRRKPLVVSAYALTAAATGALAFAVSPIQILAARCTAWLGRGLRTPGRKALLAAAVPPSAYGRAFGFERMMDTLGAIVAPVTALWLLRVTSHNYRQMFLWTLVPGALAAILFGTLVRERPLAEHAHAAKSFASSLRGLPAPFRRFLLAVGVFGLGDFSHTMLILYASQALTPSMGFAAASSVAIGLYLLHNVFYAGFAYLSGWLSDHVRHRRFVLAAGYGLAVVMAALLAAGGSHLSVLVAIFALAGIVVGVEEALEDSIAAELVPNAQHGMAFGTLAAVNALGDFGSSLLIGLLWSAVGPAAGFTAAGALFLAGLTLLLITGSRTIRTPSSV
jgi:MFS family permease